MNAIGSNNPVEVAFGGSGLATITDHSLTVGSGVAAVTELGVASNGQIPIGSNAADPVLGTITAGAGLSVTNGAGSIEVANQLTINNQTGTSYTLQLTDVSKFITCTNVAAITLTVPPESSVNFPIGTQIQIYQGGAGLLSITNGVGVTIRSGNNEYNFQYQYSVATLCKISGDLWCLKGDLA